MREFGLNEAAHLLNAGQWTLWLSLLTFVLGGLAGFAIAMMRVAKSPVPRLFAGTYVQVFQNTPLVMQLFIV